MVGEASKCATVGDRPRKDKKRASVGAWEQAVGAWMARRGEQLTCDMLTKAAAAMYKAPD